MRKKTDVLAVTKKCSSDHTSKYLLHNGTDLKHYKPYLNIPIGGNGTSVSNNDIHF
jgi:hypothetical protein